MRKESKGIKVKDNQLPPPEPEILVSSQELNFIVDDLKSKIQLILGCKVSMINSSEVARKIGVTSFFVSTIDKIDDLMLNIKQKLAPKTTIGIYQVNPYVYEEEGISHIGLELQLHIPELN